MHQSIDDYRETYSIKNKSKGFQTIVQEHIQKTLFAHEDPSGSHHPVLSFLALHMVFLDFFKFFTNSTTPFFISVSLKSSLHHLKLNDTCLERE